MDLLRTLSPPASASRSRWAWQQGVHGNGRRKWTFGEVDLLGRWEDCAKSSHDSLTPSGVVDHDYQVGYERKQEFWFSMEADVLLHTCARSSSSDHD